MRTKTYEILENRGHKEIDGQLYYPESAIMDALEYIHGTVTHIPIENFEAKLLQATERAMARLHGQPLIHGVVEEK